MPKAQDSALYQEHCAVFLLKRIDFECPFALSSLEMFLKTAFCCASFAAGGVHAAGIQPVPELDLGAYVGRWYQTYCSRSVQLVPEAGANCVTADYGVASDGIAVTVKNTVGLPFGQNVAVEGFAAPNPDVAGVFQVVLGPPGFPPTDIPTFNPESRSNYLVAAVGPKVDGAYDYAVVSDPTGQTLYVLTRDVGRFGEQYEEDVLKLVKDLGFTNFLNKPRKNNQEGCTYGPESVVV